MNLQRWGRRSSCRGRGPSPSRPAPRRLPRAGWCARSSGAMAPLAASPTSRSQAAAPPLSVMPMQRCLVPSAAIRPRSMAPTAAWRAERAEIDAVRREHAPARVDEVGGAGGVEDDVVAARCPGRRRRRPSSRSSRSRRRASAPSARTASALAALQTPVTNWRPGASRTGPRSAPTPPAAPVTSTRCPARSARRPSAPAPRCRRRPAAPRRSRASRPAGSAAIRSGRTTTTSAKVPCRASGDSEPNTRSPRANP